MSTQNQTINLFTDSRFELDPGLNRDILYHGKTINLKAVSPAMAKTLAEDKNAKYVRYSSTEMARQAKEALATAPAK